MLMRLQRYELRVQYLPGKDMYIADTLSCAYLPDCADDLLDLDLDVLHLDLLPVSASKLDAIRQATQEDPDLQLLRDVLLQG